MYLLARWAAIFCTMFLAACSSGTQAIQQVHQQRIRLNGNNKVAVVIEFAAGMHRISAQEDGIDVRLGVTTREGARVEAEGTQERHGVQSLALVLAHPTQLKIEVQGRDAGAKRGTVELTAHRFNR